MVGTRTISINMNRIPLIFIYSHDNIFQGVKQESSLSYKNKVDKDGNNLFEQLVFDEAYLPKFRELFFDAQAEVNPALSAYMREIPVEPAYHEIQDFSKDRDYTFHLLMPYDYDGHMTHSIDIKIRQFIIAYIMYRWLEIKLPSDAGIYFERSERVKDKARELLERRTTTTKINHQMF